MKTESVTSAPPYPQLNAVDQSQELSTTDWKTHTFVVLSYLLITIGIGLACAALYIAATVHPMIAVASPTLPIVLGILGLQYSDSESRAKISEPVQAPVIDGSRPIGIHNDSANCWINASLQLLFNVPAFKKVMESNSGLFSWGRSELTKAYNIYKAGGEVDSKKLRKWIHKLKPTVDPSDSFQHPADLFLNFALEQVGYSLPKEIRHQITQRAGEKDKVISIPGRSTQSFDLSWPLQQEKNKLNLSKGLNQYFHDQETNGSEVIRNRLILERAPEDFSITIDFSNETEKVTKKVQGAMAVSLTTAQVGENADYFCDGFICHLGDSTNSGHYVAYVYKDGNWWEISDSSVNQINAKVANEKISTACFIHYQRAEPAAQ